VLALARGRGILALLKQLEPKTGGTLGPNVVGVQRDHRNDLEYSLVHALAPHLVNTKSAPELGHLSGMWPTQFRAAAVRCLQRFAHVARMPAAPIALLVAVRVCRPPRMDCRNQPQGQQRLGLKSESDLISLQLPQ
jgi:hypothetical protein